MLADVDDFRAWVQGQRHRYELDRGRVVLTARGSETHNDIQVNLLAALELRLRVAERAWLGRAGHRDPVQ